MSSRNNSHDISHELQTIKTLARVIATGRKKRKLLLEVPIGIDFIQEGDRAEVLIRQVNGINALVYVPQEREQSLEEVLEAEVPQPTQEPLPPTPEVPKEVPPPPQPEKLIQETTNVWGSSTDSTTVSSESELTFPRFTGVVIGLDVIAQKLFGVALSFAYEAPRFFTMRLHDKNVHVPLFSKTTFVAEDITPPTAYELQLKSVEQTQFATLPPSDDLYSIAIEDIITRFCTDKFVQLTELLAWHERHKNDPVRFLITTGTVKEIRSLQDKTIVVINDAEANFKGGIACLIPEFVIMYSQTALEKNSNVMIIGRTNLIQDSLTQEDRLIIDCFGVYQNQKKQ